MEELWRRDKEQAVPHMSLKYFIWLSRRDECRAIGCKGVSLRGSVVREVCMYMHTHVLNNEAL